MNVLNNSKIIYKAYLFQNKITFTHASFPGRYLPSSVSWQLLCGWCYQGGLAMYSLLSGKGGDGGRRDRGRHNKTATAYLMQERIVLTYLFYSAPYDTCRSQFFANFMTNLTFLKQENLTSRTIHQFI